MTLDRSARNRILLIAYHFPPSAAVGGTRMANFAKWLPSSGWEPYVLTIRDRACRAHGSRRGCATSMRVAIEKVARTAYGDWNGIGAVKARFACPAKDAPRSRSGIRLPLRPRSLSRRGPVQEAQALSSFVSRSSPTISEAGSCPRLRRAIRQLRRHRIRWIMTSCPPYSGHLIGLAVKLIAGVRWIADFRDPWMTTGWKRAYPTCALSMWIEAWLERKVIEKADLVLFNVERLRSAYRRTLRPRTGREVRVHSERDRSQCAGGEAAKRQSTSASLCPTPGHSMWAARPNRCSRRSRGSFGKARRLREAIRIKLVGQCRMVEGVPTASLIRQARPRIERGSLRSRSLRRGDGDHPPKPSCAPAGAPAALSDSRQGLRLSREPGRGSWPSPKTAAPRISSATPAPDGRSTPMTSTGSRPSSMKRWPRRGPRPRRRRPLLPGSTQGGSPRNWRAT